MAITRRQFVTRLGALAAVVGFSQAEVSKIAEAFASNTTPFGVAAPAASPASSGFTVRSAPAVPRLSWVFLRAPGERTRSSAYTTVTTGAALGLADVTPTAHLTVGGVTQTVRIRSPCGRTPA